MIKKRKPKYKLSEIDAQILIITHHMHPSEYVDAEHIVTPAALASARRILGKEIEDALVAELVINGVRLR